MRVLIVYPGVYVYGGAELVITKLANYLTKEGIKNAFLTTSILPEMRQDLNGTEIIIPQKSKSPIWNGAMTLHKGIRENLNDFDVINVHNYPAEISIFPFRKPVVWMCNEPILFLYLKFESTFFSRFLLRAYLEFDKFVVRNYIKNAVVADQYNAERFKKIYNLTPNIINYGVDHAYFSQGDRQRAKEKLHLNDDFVIVQIGMLTPFKNQLESIRTVEKLKDRIQNIKLLLVGLEVTEYKSRLQEYMREKKIDTFIRFTGHLGRESVRDIYHACDILLHPVKSQGGWLTPFEALCAKKPVIVSPEMTASNIIKKEQIGIVTDNFADAILDVYNNKEKYNKIAEQGQVWVRENLSWDKFCKKMLEMFYKATERAVESC